MANAKIVQATRDTVTLTWDAAPEAVAYAIVRFGPLVEGDDEPESNLLAAVYATTFCDIGLRPGSRYRYRLIMQLPPDWPVPEPTLEQPEPTRPVDEQTIGAETLPPTVYADSRAFFTAALKGWYCRATEAGGLVRWCPQWWRHPEAAQRVDALWMAWEQCHRDEGTAPAGWWVNYSDPNMRELFDQRGTFEGCSQHRGHNPTHRPLPEDAPAE